MSPQSMLTLEEAQAAIVSQLHPLGAQTVALDEAVDRVTTGDLHARRTLPPFDNSAMDGYAARTEDLATASPQTPVTLAVDGVIAAGGISEATLAPGHCVRIFTGAAVPAGADAVVMQEHSEPDHEEAPSRVSFVSPATPGQHIRGTGEDVIAGDVLLPAGHLLRPGDIGALAAQGCCWIETVRRPQVAIVPTGDELVEIDRPLGPGQIPNSNSHLLAALVRQAGGYPLRLPVVPDDPDALEHALTEAARVADLILTSAGVSVGQFDHVRNVLARAGRVDFWRVAIKPGKPLAFGTFAGVPLIGLPGNPASAFVTFELFARPAVRRLGGHLAVFPPRFPAALATPYVPNPRRRELVRGRIENRRGALLARPLSQQGSGQLSSMLGVDALLDIPPGTAPLAAGSEIVAWILSPQSLAE